MSRIRRCTLAGIYLAFALATHQAVGQGIIIPGGGPIHRGMAGTSTAAPVDSIGALYWNPATISALPQSELGFGIDAIFANHSIGSSVGLASGSTSGESGAVPVPNVGWVHHLDGSPFTLGLGVNGIGGFKTNVPASATNPVIAPPPAGLGSVSAEAAFLQIAPVVSVLVTENLSIAGGPTITAALVGLEPFVLDSANTNGRYASGKASRYHWGGGAQVGFFYTHNCCWSFGGSVKTPTWMETFRFFGQDANSNHRVLHADIDLPLVVSLGTSFSPTDDLLFALDIRYLDYKNTDGLGDRAMFDNTGKLNGLDWSSVFAMSMGVQKRLSDKFTVRGGYGYNQLPIKNSESIFNLGSPLLYQHRFTGGASYYLSPSTAISAGYEFWPEVSRTGPMVLPTGVVPGATVTNVVSVHTASVGITVRH